LKESLIKIEKAVYLNNYRVELLFNDGKIEIIDLDEFLKKSSNPQTRKYLNKEFFRKFKIVTGDLVWGDYEMCFPVLKLYEGKIQ
jgi:hypothetical protein